MVAKLMAYRQFMVPYVSSPSRNATPTAPFVVHCGHPLFSLLQSAVGLKGLELLVQNLSRLDESNEEDAKGVNTTMGVLENLLEVRPLLALRCL